jgi:hypothetical protein
LLINSIPDDIDISIFKISGKVIKNALSNKHKSIYSLEKELISKIALQKREEIQLKFDQIRDQIRFLPMDIEELAKIKD